MDLTKLNTELKTDPLTRGYSAMGDVEAAVSINKPDRSPDVDSVNTGTLRACFVAADWTALDAAQKSRLDFLLGSPTLAIPAHIRSELRNLFPQGNATRTALTFATRRTGSRAEELGLGRVTESDIADARRLP